jgi:hypothetical protein
MKTRIVWLICSPLALLLFFFALSGLAQGQGPVLTALPTPTPLLPPPEPPPAGDVVAQALPDLIVSKIETVPPTPLVGQPAVIAVTIKNQGSGWVPSGHNFLVDLYIDPPFEPVVNYHQIYSPTLGLPWGGQWFYVPPDTSYVFTTTWVFTDVNTFDIWAMVDSNGENETDADGNITEANEDNNARWVNVSVLTRQHFGQATHQDFMTFMASSLDNSDLDGALSLGSFYEPPFFGWPFSQDCQIRPDTVLITDTNILTPDSRLNQVMAGRQVEPQLVTDGHGVVVAVWQDGRAGDTYNRDIYLRASADGGQTWGPEERVNDDSSSNQLHPVAALSQDGNLLVAWQDRRNGTDYDIYVQPYTLTTTIEPGEEPRVNLNHEGWTNMLAGGPGPHTMGDQINPDIAVDEEGGFHVAWQHNWNNNDDIFATSYIPYGGGYAWTLVRRVNDDNSQPQQNPSIQVIDWLKPIGVTLDIAPEPPYTVTVTGVISEPVQILAVTWEDYRYDNDDHADIAMAASIDRGETYSFDAFITHSATDGDQQNPDVIVTQDTAEVDLAVTLPDESQTTVQVEVPVGEIHTVWQGYNTPAELDRDVFYNLSKIEPEQQGNSLSFRYKLNVGSSQKINQDDTMSWQTAPVDQLDPALTAAPCMVDGEEAGNNVFMAWADGRNYDNRNYDIYYTVKSNCPGMPEGLAQNLMLNDGVRLHNFDASSPSYEEYDAGSPPPAKQLNPTLAADIYSEWPFVSGHLYAAWQDDRAGNPQAESDVYFARSNLTYFNQDFAFGAGGYISDILDSASEETAWYTIDWTGYTDDSTYITLQTRLGDTITDVLASEWYPQRFPFQPQPWDCAANESGAPLPGYGAPGQHIEDAAGLRWPQARYIQYRVNFFTRESDKTPLVDDVTIYFDNGIPEEQDNQPKTQRLYLPLIIR